MKTYALLVALLWGACTSSSGPDETSTVSFPAACPEQACQPGATVSSADELALLINFTPTVSDARYTTGCRPASSDVAVQGTITLRSSDVAVPSGCEAPGCRPQVMFRLSDAPGGASPAGTTCLDPEHWFDFTVCGGVTIADTTVRLRSLLRDVHPGTPGYVPIVEIVPACAAPCAEGQLACAATHTCWQNARDYCAYCLGGDNDQCACWNGTAPTADGAACSFYVTGDIAELGTCVAGRCDPS